MKIVVDTGFNKLVPKIIKGKDLEDEKVRQKISDFSKSRRV